MSPSINKNKNNISRFECSRLKNIKSTDGELIYCKKCILCFLHAQQMKQNNFKLTWAPKKKQRLISEMFKPAGNYLFYFYVFK